MAINNNTLKIFGKLINDTKFPSYTPAPKAKSFNFKPIKPIKIPQIAAPDKNQATSASYILSHMQAPNDNLTKHLSADVGDYIKGGHSSPITKIFDYLSIPLYTTSNIAHEFIDNSPEHSGLGEFIHDFGEAEKDVAGGAARLVSDAPDWALPLSGVKYLSNKVSPGTLKHFVNKYNPKLHGSDLLKELGTDNKIARYGLGFGLDVALDPLTYIPGLDIVSGIKKFNKARKAVPIAGVEDAAERIPKNIKNIYKAPVAKGKSKVKMPTLAQIMSNEAPKKITRKELKPTITREPVKDLKTGKNVNYQSALVDMPDNFIAKIKNPYDDEEIRKAFVSLDKAQKAARARHGYKLPENEAKSIGKEKIAKMGQTELKKRGLVSGTTKATHKPTFSMPETESMIQKIKTGQAKLFVPEVKNATGEAAQIAKDVADKYIGRKAKMNPTAMSSLYHNIYKETADMFTKATGKPNIKAKGAIKWRRTTALKMLKSAEDHLIDSGKSPTYWGGARVRLSDVIKDVEPSLKSGQTNMDKVLLHYANPNRERELVSPTKDAVSMALARRTLTISDILDHSVRTAVSQSDQLAETVSKGRRAALRKDMPAVAKMSAQKLGVTEKESNAIKGAVKDVLEMDHLPNDNFMHSIGKASYQAAKEGKIDAAAMEKMDKQIEKIMGDKYKSLGEKVLNTKAVHGFMERMAAWYGLKHLYNYKRDVMEWGMENTGRRGTLMRHLVKHYNKDEIANAFMVAQGRAAANSAREANLAKDFINYMDSILGSVGMKAEQEGTTVAAQSQAFMEQVNMQLDRADNFFRFKKGAVTDAEGNTVDYGNDWMKSWESAGIQHPASFLYDLDTALENVAKENSLWDEVAARWGSRTKSLEHRHEVITESGRLQGYYFSHEIAKEVKTLDKSLRDIWKPDSPLIKWYSRGLRAWKTGVTIYLPSFHIRNLIGDLHLMWWAGHNDPRLFIKARRVMHSQRGKYSQIFKEASKTATTRSHETEFEELSDLTHGDITEWANTTPEDIIINKKGVRLNARQIYTSAFQHGLLPDVNRLEDIFGEAPLGHWQPFKGYVKAGASRASEYREHYVRLAHYMGAVQKAAGKTAYRNKNGSANLKKIFDDAAMEVRKFHPDGRGMTNFEKNIRLVFPFYSWTRKSIPLIVQAAVTRPSKILYYPRATYALQNMLGIDSKSIADPFPDDQLFPSWIKAKGIGPIGNPEGGAVAKAISMLGQTETNDFGKQYGYTIVNPSNPFNDTFASFIGMGGVKGPFSGIVNMATPGVTIPYELATGRSTFTGAPIGQNTSKYVASNIPLVAPAARIVNTLEGKQKQKQEGPVDKEALINLLTAAGVRGTGPYIRSAEYEQGGQ